MSGDDLKKFEISDLLALIRKESDSETCSVCKKQGLKQWSNITDEIEGNLIPVAEFNHSETSINRNGYTEYHPDGTNYWSPDAPIAVHYYPYHECQIKVCSLCSAVFLTYTDYSGHGPQHRIRYVDEKLIVTRE